MYKKGRPLPIWGTCLGYEAVIQSLSRYRAIRKKVPSVNHSLNLDINPRFQNFLRQYFSKSLLNTVNDEPLIYFNHKFAYLPKQFSGNKSMGRQIDILASTSLENGTKVVSMVKHKTYPFIGVQFHPEKVQFEHRSSVKTNISYQSVEMAHKLAMMFFDQVSHNPNEFGN